MKWLLALIPLAGAAAGTARAVKTAADETYVRRDTFAMHLAGEALVHQHDSASAASDFQAVRSVIFGLDSSDRCRRGFRSYCR